MNDEREKIIKLNLKAGQVFTPGSPVNEHALFAGRLEQMRDVLNSITQRGQHIIIYGERGVGKTSLANVLSAILSGPDIDLSVSKTIINCDAQDDFSSLWHKIFHEIELVDKTSSIGFIQVEEDEIVPLSRFLPETVAPDDIRLLLHKFSFPYTIIIDEVDRINNRQDTVLLADTIKNLSDHSINTTLVLLGVADAVDELIAEHQSIERCLTQVRMPRMSTNELLEILDNGLKKLAMTMEDKAKQSIASLSQGLPHYTHLLGLYAVQNAIENKKLTVDQEDVSIAIDTALRKGQQSIRNLHHKAISSSRSTIYAEVLLACALAPADDLGYFAASDVREPLSNIMGKSYSIPAFARHLNDFCDDKRGPVLQKTGFTRRFRYRFINPLIQPYVILDGIAKGLIDSEV